MIEFAPDRPIWQQVAEIIRARIEDGTYQPRQPVPSENQMIKEFGIARATARKAFAHLRETGYIYTVKSLGSFVTPPEDRPPNES